MITFTDRSKVSTEWGAFMDRAFFGAPEMRAHGLSIVRYGIEDSLITAIHDHLMRSGSPTARHLRYRSDRVLCFTPVAGDTAGNRELAPSTRFLEYKMTLTPRYSDGSEQYDRGQIEADAFDEYIRLTDAGLDVLVLVYCPYHKRPLLSRRGCARSVCWQRRHAPRRGYA